MSKGEKELLEENEMKSNKKKLMLWGSLAIVVMLLIVAFLLIFLIPRDQEYYVGLESSLDVVLEGDGGYKEGEDVTISASDIEGYRFRNWTLNGIEISKDKEYTFKAGETTEGTYIANYDKIFTITIQDDDGTLSVDKTEAIENEEVNITINNPAGIKGIYYILEGTSVRVDILNNKFSMPLGNVTIFVSYAEELEQKGLVFEIDEETKTADLIDAPSNVVVPQSFSYYYKAPTKQYILNEDVLVLQTDVLETSIENVSKVMEYFNPIIDSQFALYSDVLYTPNNGEQSVTPIMMLELCAKIIMGEFTEEAFPMKVEVLYSLSLGKQSELLELSGQDEIMQSSKLMADYILAMSTILASSGGIFDQEGIWLSVNSDDIIFTLKDLRGWRNYDLKTGFMIALNAYFMGEEALSGLAYFPIELDLQKIKIIKYIEGDDYTVDCIREVPYSSLTFENITIPSTVKNIYSGYDGIDFNNTTINFLGDIDQWLSIDFNSYGYGSVYFNNMHLYINGELLTEVVLDKDIDISMLGIDLKKITITDGVNDLYNNSYSSSALAIEEVIVESAEIYKKLTSNYSCASIIANAVNIRVLKTIVDNPENTNTYLNDTANYTKAEDGDYYVYTKANA